MGPGIATASQIETAKSSSSNRTRFVPIPAAPINQCVTEFSTRSKIIITVTVLQFRDRDARVLEMEKMRLGFLRGSNIRVGGLIGCSSKATTWFQPMRVRVACN